MPYTIHNRYWQYPVKANTHLGAWATYAGLCGMPAWGQAVGCGACETPELWRGATGLCARVRACAGAAESLHKYMHTMPHPSGITRPAQISTLQNYQPSYLAGSPSWARKH